MQALILAGGEGTRLRPLTTTVPKPVVPLVDRPFIAFMLEWLRVHGVDDVIMSCGFLASGVRNVLGDGQGYGMRIRYVEEPRPLGTGGALKFAESLLDERFMMLNGDVLADLDLTAQIAQHERTGAVARSPRGGRRSVQLRARPPGRGHEVLEFLRSRRPTPGRREHDLRRRLRPRTLRARPAGARQAGVDRARGLPPARRPRALRLRAEGYWLDIGTPERYLQGTFDILEGVVATEVQQRLGDQYLYVARDVQNWGASCPPRSSSPAAGSARAPTSAAASCSSAASRRRAHAGRAGGRAAGRRGRRQLHVRGCVVGPGVRIGDHTQVDGLAVLGEGVTIGADNVITNGARIFPGVEIPDGGLLF